MSGTDIRHQIRAAHLRYFDELHGIAECVDLLEDAQEPEVVVDEIWRRIAALSGAMREVGLSLCQEAA